MPNIIYEQKSVIVISKDDGIVLAELRKEGYKIVEIKCGIWDGFGNVYTKITAEKGEEIF